MSKASLNSILNKISLFINKKNKSLMHNRLAQNFLHLRRKYFKYFMIFLSLRLRRLKYNLKDILFTIILKYLYIYDFQINEFTIKF